MSIYEILCLIASFLSIGVSLLMWTATYRTLKEVQKQNFNICNSMKSDTVNKIHTEHQNIFGIILQDNELISIFNELDGTNNLETKENIITTLLLNHIRTMFSFYVKGFLDKDDWTGMQNDIKDLIISLPFIKNRWNEIKCYYTEEYQDFIDKLVTKGRYFYKEEHLN